jgi:formate C-acetyltransferase
MTERVARLRERSFSAKPSVSAERAVIMTEVYSKHEGLVPVPVLRALAFKELCERKTIYIGEDDLIVGERGPFPKATPTYPELTCHSVEDLMILRTRPMTSFDVSDETIDIYRTRIIPYWRGKSIRDQAFSDLPPQWAAMYRNAVFTEFMEQRAAGHTALDGLLYRKGLRTIKAEVCTVLESLDPEGKDYAGKKAELEAMAISCDAAIRFAERHAELAEHMATECKDSPRVAELRLIARTCRKVPAEAPETFLEAVQAYWFVHLGTITELNGWDAMSPGHFDQHLEPFYQKEIAAGLLTRGQAREILSTFWIKVNNTPAPPKVGVTAAESGTYNDFTNIDLGGLKADGTDGSGELTTLMLEVQDELRLLQPQANLQVSNRTPDRILEAACSEARKGAGYPSLFNADEIILAQVAMGKSLPDAREGGTSGCVETGCFGKEAYILHGYLNGPKLLALALNNGIDPQTGERLGPSTGDPETFASFEEVYQAWELQLRNAVDCKHEFDNKLAEIYGSLMPAPFLSIYMQDCVRNAKDYYCGGARYNTDYIQCTGLGTTTDSLSVIKTLVFESGKTSMKELCAALASDWNGYDRLRALARNKVPLFGNDDGKADSLAVRVFNSYLAAMEGRRSWRGGSYHADFLSTTCHVYFGSRTAATPDGRKAGEPLSDGTSPSHGADRNGPTAVMNSLCRLDQARSGGTLLNQRFTPGALEGDQGVKKLAALVRGYFRQGGHHVQFNVVDAKTLLAARARPEDYRNLLVRVAGYSDYFVDLDEHHQNEIISRTAHGGL